MKNRIKVERAELNITQAELASRAGVSRQTINAMELGKYVPSTALALKLASIFGTSVENIFSLEEKDWTWSNFESKGVHSPG
ncbi:MAG: helix-turn-helix transcriptional regulator [Flavobacteriaceae bacterium]|nr:MAG: helix-turn-helix transcriptional regulator [Flavobacteriaceae bacterium]